MNAERERETCRTQRDAGLTGLADHVRVDVDPAQLAAALARARVAIRAIERKRLWFLRRWRLQARLAAARKAIGDLAGLLGIAGSEAADPPELGELEPVAVRLLSVLESERRIAQLTAFIDSRPRKHEIDDVLHALGEPRATAGRAVLDAGWDQRRSRAENRQRVETWLETFSHRSGQPQPSRRSLAMLPTLLSALPVWAVTNLSCRRNLPMHQGLFDLVIIDEASQCDIASVLPLLVRARRAMIIGDPNQLQHIATLGPGRDRAIARNWGLSDERADRFSYRDRSCYALAADRIGDAPILLDLHFRSHPAIFGFVARHVYRTGTLKCCTRPGTRTGGPPVEWVDIVGDGEPGPSGQSRINRLEAAALARQVAQHLSSQDRVGSIGIVTPYRAQARQISSVLSGLLPAATMAELTIATAYSFQGDERDTIFFSPVIDQQMTVQQVAFASDPNLVNVAVTRARHRLVIVGNQALCSRLAFLIGDLARYCAELSQGGFDHPLQMEMGRRLRDLGYAVQAGFRLGHHRLALAVAHGDRRVDVEFDAAAFEQDAAEFQARDSDLAQSGWTVLRFSCRELGRNPEAGLATVVDTLQSGSADHGHDDVTSTPPL